MTRAFPLFLTLTLFGCSSMETQSTGQTVSADLTKDDEVLVKSDDLVAIFEGWQTHLQMLEDAQVRIRDASINRPKDAATELIEQRVYQLAHHREAAGMLRELAVSTGQFYVSTSTNLFPGGLTSGFVSDREFLVALATEGVGADAAFTAGVKLMKDAGYEVQPRPGVRHATTLSRDLGWCVYTPAIEKWRVSIGFELIVIDPSIDELFYWRLMPIIRASRGKEAVRVFAIGDFTESDEAFRELLTALSSAVAEISEGDGGNIEGSGTGL